MCDETLVNEMEFMFQYTDDKIEMCVNRVSVLGESGEIFLSHIIFLWEDWPHLSPPSHLSLLTSDLCLQLLHLLLVRSQNSGLQTKEGLLCPPSSVLYCLPHTLDMMWETVEWTHTTHQWMVGSPSLSLVYLSDSGCQRIWCVSC